MTQHAYKLSMGSVSNVLDISDVIGQVLKYDLGSLSKEHVYFVRWYTVPEEKHAWVAFVKEVRNHG